MVARVAAQEDGDVVLFEDRLLRIAWKAARCQERRLLRTAVVGRVPPPRSGDATLEVRQPPGDRDAEAGRGRLVPSLELLHRFLKLACGGARVAVADLCGHELMVERRYDDFDAVVLDRCDF